MSEERRMDNDDIIKRDIQEAGSASGVSGSSEGREIEKIAEVLWKYYKGTSISSWAKTCRETPWIADYYRGGARAVMAYLEAQ